MITILTVPSIDRDHSAEQADSMRSILDSCDCIAIHISCKPRSSVTILQLFSKVKCHSHDQFYDEI